MHGKKWMLPPVCRCEGGALRSPGTQKTARPLHVRGRAMSFGGGPQARGASLVAAVTLGYRVDTRAGNEKNAQPRPHGWGCAWNRPRDGRSPGGCRQ